MEKPAFRLPNVYLNAQNQSTIFGYVMIVLMMLSLSTAFALAGARILPGWNGLYLVIIGVLLAMEGIYARKLTTEFEFRQRIFFLLSEWVAFAVILKILLYLLNDPSQLLADLPRWQENFLETFFTGEYVFSLLVMLLVWLLSRSYAGELEDLYNHEIDVIWDDLGKVQNTLSGIRARITARVFIVGTGIVILSVFSRIELNTNILSSLTGVAYTIPVINVLFYFFLALLVLSQTQFALLRTRWLWQRLTISSQIAANWIRYGLLAFLILTVIVFFLPTNYSLGLLETLRIGLGYVMQLFSFLIFIFTLPFTLCLSLLSLFGREQPQQRPEQPQSVTQFPPGGGAGDPIAWLEFLRSLLFWGLFLAIIFFALRYYLSQNTALWNAITGFPLLRFARRVLSGMWRWLRGANRQIAEIVQEGIKRIRARRIGNPIQSARRIFNLARMSPRERIIYFYLSVVQLGAEQGIERRPSQTPYDYENRLVREIPEIHPELHGLTETFLEARYSNHPVEQNKSEQASSLWERIKAILRRWKREEEEE